MSFRHGLAVGLLPLKNPTIKTVLLALAHHAGEYTSRCWPSVDRIALFTGLSRRAVQQALRDAETLELIRITERQGKPNLYDFLLSGTEPMDQFAAEGAASAPLAEGGAGGAPRGAGGAPKESKNTTTHANNARENFSSWEPLPKTIERIIAEEGMDQAVIDGQLRLFRMKVEATEDWPKNADSAFRMWCARHKDLKGPVKASGPRRPPPSSERSAEVLRQLIDNKEKLIGIYEKQGKNYEIEHQLRPEIAALNLELFALETAQEYKENHK
jgi:hypothetical protein